MGNTNQKAVEFLQSLDIPVVKHDGFDQRQVYAALRQLTGIYEEILAEQNERCERALEDAKRELAALQTEQGTARAPQPGGDTEYTEKLEELAQAALFLKSEQDRVMADAERGKSEILSRAQQEACRIKQDARAESLRQRQELTADIARLRQQKEEIISLLDTVCGRIIQLMKEGEKPTTQPAADAAATGWSL